MMIFTYLDRLLKSDSVLLTKADSSPFKHLSLLSEVGDLKICVLCEKCSVLATDQIIDFIEQIFAS